MCHPFEGSLITVLFENIFQGAFMFMFFMTEYYSLFWDKKRKEPVTSNTGTSRTGTSKKRSIVWPILRYYKSGELSMLNSMLPFFYQVPNFSAIYWCSHFSWCSRIRCPRLFPRKKWENVQKNVNALEKTALITRDLLWEPKMWKKITCKKTGGFLEM